MVNIQVGLVWFGLVWIELVWFGLDRFGLVFVEPAGGGSRLGVCVHRGRVHHRLFANKIRLDWQSSSF